MAIGRELRKQRGDAAGSFPRLSLREIAGLIYFACRSCRAGHGLNQRPTAVSQPIDCDIAIVEYRCFESMLEQARVQYRQLIKVLACARRNESDFVFVRPGSLADEIVDLGSLKVVRRIHQIDQDLAIREALGQTSEFDKDLMESRDVQHAAGDHYDPISRVL